MSEKITTAMILAAGLGLRMRPLTETTPKPLIEVLGRTLLDRALDRLVEAEVEKVVVNASYLADQIIAHVKKRQDIEIIISHEETPLETGGGVMKALPHLGTKPFFAMNSDAILLNGPKPTLTRMAKNWDPDKTDVLLLLHPLVSAHGYDGKGDYGLKPDGLLKESRERGAAPYVFTGTQILHPRVFKDRFETKWSLKQVYDDALHLRRARALVHEGEWFHVGTPQGLKDAETFLSRAYPDSGYLY